MKKKLLSSEQAFRAMFLFLCEYHKRTGGQAKIADVLGDVQLNRTDGMPADPAAWDDWLAVVDTVLTDRITAGAKPTP